MVYRNPLQTIVPHGAFRKAKIGETLHLPEPRQPDYDFYNNLHVPETAPVGSVVSYNNQGFIDSKLFRCADGTIIDIDKRCIVKEPEKGNPNEWGKQRDITFGDEKSWNDNGDEMTSTDIAYQQTMKKETKKMMSNLTDEQIRFLKELESGTLVGKSRLELED